MKRPHKVGVFQAERRFRNGQVGAVRSVLLSPQRFAGTGTTAEAALGRLTNVAAFCPANVTDTV